MILNWHGQTRQNTEWDYWDVYITPKIQIRDEPHTYTDWKPKTHKITTGRIDMIKD